MHILTDLFTRHGVPDHIRSDNGSEFTATAVREWLPKVGVKNLSLVVHSMGNYLLQRTMHDKDILPIMFSSYID